MDADRYRLFETRNVLEGQFIIERLHRAGIAAELSSAWADLTGILSGGERVSIWVFSEADLQAGYQVLQHMQQEKLMTRLDPAAPQAHYFCSNCGYDLRGHFDQPQGTCPECEHPYKIATEDVICASCGEAVPGHFELCWNCGQDLPTTPPE